MAKFLCQMTGEEFLQLNELARKDATEPSSGQPMTHAYGIGELAIFPKAIQDIIHDLDVENGYPIPYTAAAFFHAFACAIGNSCTCRFMENWETAPILYTALVGGPGSIKTHPVSFAMAPLVRRDKVSLGEYSQLLERYRSAQIDARGPKPKARQRIMRDTTLEALAKVLKANPVGVCVYVDELKGWLNSFNKYRNVGGDKALAPVLSFADALLLLLAAYRSCHSISATQTYSHFHNYD